MASIKDVDIKDNAILKKATKNFEVNEIENMNFGSYDNDLKTRVQNSLTESGRNFLVRDSFKGDPSNLYIFKDIVASANALFGKGRLEGEIGSFVDNNGNTHKINWNKIVYTDVDGVEKTVRNEFTGNFSGFRLAAQLGHIPLAGVPDAANGEDRYFSKSGETFTEKDLVDTLIDKPEVQYHLKNTIKNYVDMGIEFVPDGETIVFENDNPLIGTDDTVEEGEEYTLNIIAFLHHASANSIGEITNNGGKYTLKLRYFLEDVYDWKSGYNDTTPGKVEQMYFNQLLLGNAKSYLIHIENDMLINFDSNGEYSVIYYDKPIYK